MMTVDFDLKYMVWSCTKACNFHCLHCAKDDGDPLPNELSTEEGRRLLEQVAEIGVDLFIIFARRIMKSYEPQTELTKACSLHDWLEIAEDGRVFPCRSMGLLAGDLRVHSLKEIWEQSLMSLRDTQNHEKGDPKKLFVTDAGRSGGGADPAALPAGEYPGQMRPVRIFQHLWRMPRPGLRLHGRSVRIGSRLSLSFPSPGGDTQGCLIRVTPAGCGRSPLPGR